MQFLRCFVTDTLLTALATKRQFQRHPRHGRGGTPEPTGWSSARTSSQARTQAPRRPSDGRVLIELAPGTIYLHRGEVVPYHRTRLTG